MTEEQKLDDLQKQVKKLQVEIKSAQENLRESKLEIAAIEELEKSNEKLRNRLKIFEKLLYHLFLTSSNPQKIDEAVLKHKVFERDYYILQNELRKNNHNGS